MAAPSMHISQQLIRKEPVKISGDSIMCFGAKAFDMELGNYHWEVYLYSRFSSSTMRSESVPKSHHIQSYVTRQHIGREPNDPIGKSMLEQSRQPFSGDVGKLFLQKEWFSLADFRYCTRPVYVRYMIGFFFAKGCNFAGEISRPSEISLSVHDGIQGNKNKNICLFIPDFPKY